MLFFVIVLLCKLCFETKFSLHFNLCTGPLKPLLGHPAGLAVQFNSCPTEWLKRPT